MGLGGCGGGVGWAVQETGGVERRVVADALLMAVCLCGRRSRMLCPSTSRNHSAKATGRRYASCQSLKEYLVTVTPTGPNEEKKKSECLT